MFGEHVTLLNLCSKPVLKMKSECLQNVLNECLDKACNSDLDVASVTLDGASKNLNYPEKF